MATRIKDGEIPYTGGIGIEITNNHVINVLLRKLNNLIHVNDNRELYVDLQLPDGIEPDDDFPVGVTTGEILQEDGWQQSGTIINWKTTSGDYTRIIYANDGKLYYDPGTGQWIPFATGGELPGVATESVLGLIKLGSDTKQTEPAQSPTASVGKTYPIQLNADNQAVVNVPWTDTNTEYESLPEENGGTDESLCTTGEKYIWNHKQDKLTAGTRISITVDPQTGDTIISADITGVFIYKGNVTDPSQLPQSGNTVGDCWISESDDIMYAWDGTQWNPIGSTAIDLSPYFNKNTDTSDDITEGTTNLFVTTPEKTRWNNKQDKIIAGRNITIDADGVTINATDTDTTYTAGHGISIDANDNNKIANELPFEPDNQGSVGQFLKRTSNGYQWANVPGGGGGGGGGTEYEAGYGIDITDNVITNTKPFNPTNNGKTGQVLKKTPSGMIWANESGGGGGETPNVKLFTFANEYDTATAQEVVDYLDEGNLPIIKLHATLGYIQKEGDYYFYPVIESNSTSEHLVFQTISTSNDAWVLSDGIVQRKRPIIYIDLLAGTRTVNSTGKTYQIASRENTIENWIGTLAQYEQITPVNGVIYNILPNS